MNLSDTALDVFVRSQGVVRAAAAATGVAPGTVTPDFFPPEPGTVIVGRAGSTDSTCVSGCDFLASSSTNFGEGDQRTVVVRNDGATEFWEHPMPTSLGTMANAIGPADPALALVFVVAQGVDGARFGLRLAHQGVPGCQQPVRAPDALIGGTQVVSFGLEPGTEVAAALHDSSDRDCSAAPVGGPFQIGGAAGSRTFLFLYGTVGAMGGLGVPIP